jgi:putative AdoMet-dependent methyltransferase
MLVVLEGFVKMNDEIYFVLDEIRRSFPQAEFEQKSYCFGIIKIGRGNN